MAVATAFGKGDSSLKSLWEKRKLGFSTDVLLVCVGNYLRCHKKPLMEASPVFKAKLKEYPTVLNLGIKSQEAYYLLKVVYGLTFTFPCEFMPSLVALLNVYKISQPPLHISERALVRPNEIQSPAMARIAEMINAENDAKNTVKREARSIKNTLRSKSTTAVTNDNVENINPCGHKHTDNSKHNQKVSSKKNYKVNTDKHDKPVKNDKNSYSAMKDTQFETKNTFSPMNAPQFKTKKSCSPVNATPCTNDLNIDENNTKVIVNISGGVEKMVSDSAVLGKSGSDNVVHEKPLVNKFFDTSCPKTVEDLCFEEALRIEFVDKGRTRSRWFNPVDSNGYEENIVNNQASKEKNNYVESSSGSLQNQPSLDLNANGVTTCDCRTCQEFFFNQYKCRKDLEMHKKIQHTETFKGKCKMYPTSDSNDNIFNNFGLSPNNIYPALDVNVNEYAYFGNSKLDNTVNSRPTVNPANFHVKNDSDIETYTGINNPIQVERSPQYTSQCHPTELVDGIRKICIDDLRGFDGNPYTLGNKYRFPAAKDIFWQDGGKLVQEGKADKINSQSKLPRKHKVTLDSLHEDSLSFEEWRKSIGRNYAF